METVFDLDEDIMKSWITAQPKQAEGDLGRDLDVASCLLEAARQLRWESEREIIQHVSRLKKQIFCSHIVSQESKCPLC